MHPAVDIHCWVRFAITWRPGRGTIRIRKCPRFRVTVHRAIPSYGSFGNGSRRGKGDTPGIGEIQGKYPGKYSTQWSAVLVVVCPVSQAGFKAAPYVNRVRNVVTRVGSET
jgi:hypothetical protein